MSNYKHMICNKCLTVNNHYAVSFRFIFILFFGFSSFGDCQTTVRYVELDRFCQMNCFQFIKRAKKKTNRKKLMSNSTTKKHTHNATKEMLKGHDIDGENQKQKKYFHVNETYFLSSLACFHVLVFFFILVIFFLFKFYLVVYRFTPFFFCFFNFAFNFVGRMDGWMDGICL